MHLAHYDWTAYLLRYLALTVGVLGVAHNAPRRERLGLLVGCLLIFTVWMLMSALACNLWHACLE